MNFLIVVPRYTDSVGGHYEFPLGLAYISSALKQHGLRVVVLNLNHSCEAVELMVGAAIEHNNIDVVCTGGLSPHYKKIKLIIETARITKKGIRIILGGGVISSGPELVMKLLRPDFGVIGEGEQTIVELAIALKEGRDYSYVNGLALLKGDDEVVMTQPRKLVADIDTIAPPDYDGFELDAHLSMQTPADDLNLLYPYDEPRVMPMIASRSCPYQCTFCFHPVGSEYRQRGLDSFFSELDYLVRKFRVNILSILDELFSFSSERVREFCARIKPYNIKFTTSMRVDGVDAEILSLLKEAGCIMLCYGLESASDTILGSMKKHTTIALIEKTLEMTYKAGIGIQGNFIYGDKVETRETVETSFDWWVRQRKYLATMNLLRPYPGTEVYRYAVGHGIIKDPIEFIENGCPPVNITSLSESEYNRIFLDICRLRIQYPIPAHVISYRVIGSHPLKGNLYRIELVCPHCRKTIVYNNMHHDYLVLFPLGCRICCKNCNQRFDILPFRFYEYLQNPEMSEGTGIDFEGSNGIAIYGAGGVGYSVYEFCQKMGKRVLYFIDDYKEGTWDGLEIIKPEVVERYPRPDLTIFAIGSPERREFPSDFLEKVKRWNYSKAYLLSLNSVSDSHIQSGGDLAIKYYSYYFFERWLPLMERGFD